MPTLTLELASASPPNPLQCLACLSTRTPLQMRLQHCPPSPPSLLLTLLHPCLIFSLAYNTYTPAGPSSNASNATLTPLTPPCTHLLPSLLSWMPAQNASDAAYHPYDLSALPTCLQCCLPSLYLQCPPYMPPTPPSHWPNPQGRLRSLHSCSFLKMRLQCCPPSLPSPPLMLLNPHLIFSTAYNSYAPSAPSIYASDATLNPPYA
ncbi:hypothetical protein O181_122560 [Austropuccinia psidii MF-1]|uniref:Uncharacterized protein n=1 Tax=Austropuccinia psidii MF-1 TaxID=1389203 RepID=A0A9Q3Q3E0_9BASI|nr:hypothetical protein [Austropuccinia psidii MF-1]